MKRNLRKPGKLWRTSYGILQTAQQRENIYDSSSCFYANWWKQRRELLPRSHWYMLLKHHYYKNCGYWNSFIYNPTVFISYASIAEMDGNVYTVLRNPPDHYHHSNICNRIPHNSFATAIFIYPLGFLLTQLDSLDSWIWRWLNHDSISRWGSSQKTAN